MTTEETTTPTPETPTAEVEAIEPAADPVTADAAPEAAEEPADAAPEAAAEAAPDIPGYLGRLTPEEQQALLGIRQKSQQILSKIGEHELHKSRLLNEINQLDVQGQQYINAVSQRFNLKDGEQWVALQDGTVRLVTPPQVSQAQTGDAPSSP